MLTLILPMGIGVVHAFHQHENNVCIAIDESHFHSEITDCDQLHYFSQTLNAAETSLIEIIIEKTFLLDEFHTEFNLIQSFSKGHSDRGPPVINVF